MFLLVTLRLDVHTMPIGRRSIGDNARRTRLTRSVTLLSAFNDFPGPARPLTPLRRVAVTVTLGPRTPKETTAQRPHHPIPTGTLSITKIILLVWDVTHRPNYFRRLANWCRIVLGEILFNLTLPAMKTRQVLRLANPPNLLPNLIREWPALFLPLKKKPAF